MKNLTPREGYLNRHINSLPTTISTIKIINQDSDGEHIFLCEWHPMNPKDYVENNMPSPGYLGSAKVIQGKFKGIGFNAWSQNNYEFIYYMIV